MVRQAIGALLFLSIAGSTLGLPGFAWADANSSRSASIIHRINSDNERQEMTVNTSRILTLERKIPQAQVNNPDILSLTPLSPTDIQLAAKKAGVYLVAFGMESGSQRILDAMNKKITVEQCARACELARKYQLDSHTSWVIGYPPETPENVITTPPGLELPPNKSSE